MLASTGGDSSDADCSLAHPSTASAPRTCLLISAAVSSPSSSTSALKRVSRPLANRSAGASYSAILPSSKKRIRSLSMIVFRRCAMVSTVRSLNSVLMTFWSVASVLTSMFAVASSRQIIRDCRSNARAKQTNCRCPTEKFSPPSCTVASRPPDKSFTTPSNEEWRSAAQISSSDLAWKRSRLSRIVPENIMASCGIIANACRRSCRPSLRTSTESINIDPLPKTGELMSTSRNSTPNNVDLPHPVRPQMPTFMPPSMTTDMPFRTKGRPSL
mmetsp:Transcript_113945/g.226720  ORF Transcript_113945/g.226720 Transcript_113945/m.226720 type:complete len:272 (-) Transcript_113945:2571-3386(-)